MPACPVPREPHLPMSFQTSIRPLLSPRNSWLLGLAATVLASLVCILFVDRSLALYFYGQRDHWVHAFFRSITEIGNGTGWYILAVLAMACGFAGDRFALFLASAMRWQRLRNAGLFLLGSLLLSGIALIALKVIFGRLRPRYLFEDGSYAFEPFLFNTGVVGFPSGHAQTIFAVMAVFWLVLPRFRLLYPVVAVLVAFSRVVVGAHYLADVIASTILALAVTAWLYDWMVRHGLSPRLQQEGRLSPPGRPPGG